MSLSPAGFGTDFPLRLGSQSRRSRNVWCNGLLIPTARKRRKAITRTPSNYRGRGTWFKLPKRSPVSTSHIAIVPTASTRTAHVVSMHPTRPAPAVEIRCQSGKTVQATLPIKITWTPNVTCYLRELNQTCKAYATRKTMPAHGDIFVTFGSHTTVLGTEHTGYVCKMCRFHTKDKREMLAHLDLPSTCIPTVRTKNETRVYNPPRPHAPQFEHYLNICTRDSQAGKKHPPYNLLPQLNPNELRRRLNNLQHTAQK